MKKFLTILITILSVTIYAQDYVVDESFTPENYGSESNPYNRLLYSWGMNFNELDLKEIKPQGSNYFDMRYQYNLKLYKGVYFVSGFGYSWNAFNLLNENQSLYSDSIYHKKRKFRFQYITSNIGLRLQSHESPDESIYLEASIYGEALMRSVYVTWDEIDGMNHKAKLSKLDFINKYNYGGEIRIGFKNLSIFSKYRSSPLINNTLIGNELPRLTIGIQLDIPSEGNFM